MWDEDRPNVSCWRCHGPGRSHVRRRPAPHKQAEDLVVPLGGWGSDAWTEEVADGAWVSPRLPESVSPSGSARMTMSSRGLPSVGLLQLKVFLHHKLQGRFWLLDFLPMIRARSRHTRRSGVSKSAALSYT